MKNNGVIKWLITNKITRRIVKIIGLIICIVIGSILIVESSIIGKTFFIIGLLGISLLSKELKLLFGITALNEFIVKVDEKEFRAEEIKKELKEYPKFLVLDKKFNTGIIDIIEGIQEAKKEKAFRENDVENLILKVINNLHKPVEDLKGKIEILDTENIEDEIINLREKEEVVEKLVLDVFNTSKSMNSDLPIKREEKNLSYILKQICGEFSLQMANSNLNYEIEIDQNKFNFFIDVEKFCEVIEILLQNAEKHSLDGSRVYIKSSMVDGFYNIEIKNISKEKLDIKPNEIYKLVNGKEDCMVTGLELERCKNLSRAIGGEFSINIDGDMFKVNLKFKKGGE